MNESKHGFVVDLKKLEQSKLDKKANPPKENAHTGLHEQVPFIHDIPKNPLDETNSTLHKLSEHTESSSVSTERWNRVMLFVSVFALCLSAFFSIVSYFSSSESATKLENLVQEQNTLLNQVLLELSIAAERKADEQKTQEQSSDPK
ncbi:TPA: hypothetical protein RZA60_004335 [Vibrio vulnificus]|nr:hypothetical protein [Vibrio vulnificus]HDY7626519.1 hypothetical protein [Vibrio vulnificus]HEB2783925.1 hypothetical protein [Vibrio vulnificus]